MPAKKQGRPPSPLPRIRMTLDTFRSAILAAIENIDVDGPEDPMLMLWDWIDNANWIVRECKKAAEERFIELLKAHAGPDGRPAEIQVGDIRYYVGTTKRTKANSNNAVLEALLEATGGDLDQMTECLSSQPWKHGAVRIVLDDQSRFDELFTTELVEDVKTGKPKKGLKVVNQAFLPDSTRASG